MSNSAGAAVVLDDAQRSVIDKAADRSGCLLVTGAPGSGKTTALVAAVSKLVSDGVPLGRIVVLTHTRPAAQRLRRQIMEATGGAQVGLRITTPHGWCQALWQSSRPPGHAALRLISAPEQEYRVRELLDSDLRVRWPPELAQAVTTPAFAAQLRFLLARTRQLGMDPDGLARAGRAAGRDDWVSAASFFDEYLDVLDAEGVLDYAELVHRCRVLLAEPDVRASVRAHTEVVFVDEFAESDESVVALLRDIWRCGVPVTAFGDPSTAVFNFRGAWPAALRRFPGEFADASGPAPVIDLPGRWRVPDIREALLVGSQDDEAAAVAQRLWLARSGGVEWSQMAVVARESGPAVVRLASGLAAAGLAVRIEGEVLALADVPAVKVLMAALRLLIDAAGATADRWVEVLCSPLVGLDEIDLRRLAGVISPADDWPETVVTGLGATCPAEGDAEVWGKAKAALTGLADLAGRLEELSPDEVAWRVWTLAGWPERLREAALGSQEDALRANRDLDAVIALFDLAATLPGRRGAEAVGALTDTVSQQVVQRDRARESEVSNAVTVLSAYQSKGRGWPVVAVVGAAEGAWPGDGWTDSLLEPERLEPDGAGPVSGRREQMGAERRLFNLAASRASRHLIVTGSPGVDSEVAALSRFAVGMGLVAENWDGGAASAAHLSARALAGELRGVGASPDAAPGLVLAAAAGLAHLRCDPRDWWWVGGLTAGQRPIAGSGPAHITATSVATLLACPRAWFMRNAGGAPRPGVSMGFGSVAHALFEAFSTGLPPGDIWSEVDQVWATLPYRAAWQSSSGRQDLEDAVSRFLAWRDGRKGRRLLGTEIGFRTEVTTPAGPVEVSGRVDRLEMDMSGRLVIVDFKTNRTAEPKAYLDQLAIYRLAVQQGVFESLAPGVRRAAPPELVWPCVEPRVRAFADVGCRVDGVADEPEGGIVSRLGRVAAILKAERFDAVRCADCRYCAFLDGCPAQALGVDNG
ncbi:MAG: ATP-dependent helicase [Propionibacteriaceae bacterium]|nr:ATP-dependent helicase [Propionibacteriaceae bacterium]